MESDFSFLFAYDRWIRFFHIAGAIVAVGAVTAIDILLAWLKFHPKAAPLVARVAPLLSLQVWIGFMMLSGSGLLLFLPRWRLERVFVFQLKMGLVFVVFLNGIFLNMWVTPKFKALASEWYQRTERMRKFTKIAGIAAAISFFGWWGIVFLMLVLY